MITLTSYVTIGFVAALILIIGISIYDEGDNSPDDYVAAGAFGLLFLLAWPVILPVAFFGVVAWLVSENVGR